MKNSIYQQLFQHIQELQHAVVAFSGGVDSSLLVYVAHEALGNNMVAITVKTPYIPAWELEEARIFAKKHKITHEVIELTIPANIIRNPPDRCYLCKKEIFTVIQSHAKKRGIHTIIEGSNKDDLSDYRPGMRALGELNIASPMLQLGISKETIRELSREADLTTWDKPAYACLLSRIPYHTEITTAELEKITQAEMVLRELNIYGSRVRSHGDIARIEVPNKNFARLLKLDLRTRLIQRIKACGYLYVTLDLEGYQTGSLNKTLTIDNQHE
ncbi:MAG: ATP-dependent sacrificial sulfur transferase LarE [Desulfobulbaceae bacterium]|nr:ATP-dependent sacrificial sulfur transferase LarE [Desulfobulbaceae bacterium]